MPRRSLHGLALFLLAGCASPTESATTLWEGSLSPVPPSTVSGTAAAVSQAGRVQVAVEIGGATAEVHTWRVVTGGCASPDRTLGGAAMYPPMSVGAGRSGRAEAVVPGELAPGGRYAAQVFVTADSSERLVACGDLAERD